MQRTQKIKTGPLVTPPIGARYHPAIVAQASATLDSLFPGRLLLGVGTGEALNERPFWNGRWPKWGERIERLTEGVRLIRKLWESKRPFSFKGKYYSSEFLYLYTRPKTKIPIYFAATGERSAYFAGKYGDKLVTISPRNTIRRIKDAILPSYKKGLEEGGAKGGLVVHLDFTMKTPRELKGKEWRSLGWMTKDSWSINDPVAVERAGRRVTIDDLKKGIHFVKDWRGLVEVIERYRAAGAEAVILISEADKKKILEIGKNLLDVF